MKQLSRSLFAGAVLCALSTSFLAGCSSDDADDATTTTVATAASGEDTTAADATADDTSADADSDEPAGTEQVSDVCGLITVEEVGALVGGTVTMSEVPGGGCQFDQEDPRAPTVAFATSTASDDTDGTFNEGRVGAFGVLTDATPESPGVGDYSAVASGTIGGDSQQGVGIVQVGVTIVQVSLIQGNGIDGAQVRAMTTQALTLAASKL